ncbi:MULTISPECIES: hypothetical protein [Thioclava]|nr:MULTISPECIES: hypothetical protein [Thioclava]|tara:strand:- start:2344 stop:2478 length:135 start_codon:yes stop_codon:yes gene_type:complete
MKTYTRPQLQKHGKLEDLTHGAGSTTIADQVLPPGTDIAGLTFS